MLKHFLSNIMSCIDHLLFLLVFPLCLVFSIIAIPWIWRQRSIWEKNAKGSKKALIMLPIAVEQITKKGFEHVLPLRNRSLDWIGLLDSTNTRKTKIKITDDLHLITWKSPNILKILKKIGFAATSIAFRELIAVFKITRYCVTEEIGVLRTYQHHYPALRAGLVSLLIKIPFIVDIAGNYELWRRLLGKTYYFKWLCHIPIIKIFGRMLHDWLLGWPLRNAFRVLGRNKNNYEHAFALGAPVEKLSLLRISNFNIAFNSYNPEKPPAKPAEYPYILFVGRLSAEKFPFDVLDAFEIAGLHLPEYRLIMIGDGALRKDVERRIANSQFKDRIVLMGDCPNDIVLKWTAHASVAICPFSGSTLVEAMLCGVPIVAYDFEWHAEVIIDDYTGFLVPFSNVAALAEKVINVVKNYDEAKRVGNRGRDLAGVIFDKEKIREKESAFYLEALKD